MHFVVYRDEMKFQPLAFLPFGIGVAASVIAASSGSALFLVVSLATVMVGLAVIYLYSKPAPVAPKSIPLEDFSLWADVGEPGAELVRLDQNDVWTAVRIAKADLEALSTNADLLSRRTKMILGKEHFGGLVREDLQGDSQRVAQRTSDLAKKIEAEGKFPPDTVQIIEKNAAILDRVANKLFAFERGKPEIVHVYTDPLKRAAEKISRDLRQAATNIKKFTESKQGPPEAPKPETPATSGAPSTSG
ncbi:MAG: hypothetical protein AB1476_01740 [Candidatus Hadarchaeota archaeon]